MFLTSKRQRKCLESTFSVSVRVLQTRIWGSAWGNPSPGVHFPRSTFASSLEEPKPRGFELMGVFLPEPGLPVAYPELLIRSWKAGGTQIKLGTGRSGGIHSTAPRLQGGASILGTPATWFSLFLVPDYEQSHQRSQRDRSLLSLSQNTNVPDSEAGGLWNTWNFVTELPCHWLDWLSLSLSVTPHTWDMNFCFHLKFLSGPQRTNPICRVQHCVFVQVHCECIWM